MTITLLFRNMRNNHSILYSKSWFADTAIFSARPRKITCECVHPHPRFQCHLSNTGKIVALASYVKLTWKTAKKYRPRMRFGRTPPSSIALPALTSRAIGRLHSRGSISTCYLSWIATSSPSAMASRRSPSAYLMVSVAGLPR